MIPTIFTPNPLFFLLLFLMNCVKFSPDFLVPHRLCASVFLLYVLSDQASVLVTFMLPILKEVNICAREGIRENDN